MIYKMVLVIRKFCYTKYKLIENELKELISVL